MAYPPSVPPNTRADNTPLPTNHAGDHNDISDALTDIINELGSDPKGGAASVTARLDALDPTAWTAVTFVNSWTNSGGSLQVTQYRKEEGGDRVYVRIAASTGASGTVAFTLPSGYRPPAEIRRPLDGAGAHAFATITAAGDVTLTGVASIQGEFSFSVTA